MSCDQSKLNEISGVGERINYFDQSQEGGQPAAIIWGGNLIWANGSNREIGHGVDLYVASMMDCSWYDLTDSREVRKLYCWKKKYAEVKLEDSIKEFSAAKKELKRRADIALVSGSVPPGIEEVRQVKRLRHQVIKFNRMLEAIEEILNPTQETYQYSEQELKRMDKNRTEADRILSSLEKIEI